MRAVQQSTSDEVEETQGPTGQCGSGDRVCFSKPISLRCFIFISLLTLACVVLPYIGFFREDIQRILFPIFLLVFLLAPKSSVIRLPLLFVALAGLGWLLASLHITGVLRLSPGEQIIFVTRLEEGPEHPVARTFYRRFNEVAARYSLPDLRMLDREFEDSASLRTWLNTREGSVFALRGKPPWLDVVLSNISLKSEGVSAVSEYPELVDRLHNSGINDFSSLYVFSPNWLGAPLVVDSSLSSFKISIEPQELALHYLGWLSKGLSSLGAEREEYLHAASVIEGQWKSSEPLGVARYFLGIQYLADSYRNGLLEQMGVTCAQEMFRIGSASLNPKYSPEAYSLLFNNASVARVFAAYRAYDFEKAYLWLAKAAGVQDKQGVPTRGARLALVNMSALYQAGVIEIR